MTEPILWERITKGKGSGPDAACIMVRAAYEHAVEHGYLHDLPLDEILTDRPCWANEALTSIAICCNDRASDEQRERMRPLKDRVLRATRRAPEVEHRITARVLCQQARKVLHLVPAKDRDACERAIATREACLRGEATEEECQTAAEAAWAAWAVRAAWAAGVAAAAGAAEAAGVFDPVDWLDDALDAWEKAAAEEGALMGDGEAERLVNEFVQAGGA